MAQAVATGSESPARMLRISLQPTSLGFLWLRSLGFDRPEREARAVLARAAMHPGDGEAAEHLGRTGGRKSVERQMAQPEEAIPFSGKRPG